MQNWAVENSPSVASYRSRMTTTVVQYRRPSSFLLPAVNQAPFILPSSRFPAHQFAAPLILPGSWLTSSLHHSFFPVPGSRLTRSLHHSFFPVPGSPVLCTIHSSQFPVPGSPVLCTIHSSRFPVPSSPVLCTIHSSRLRSWLRTCTSGFLTPIPLPPQAVEGEPEGQRGRGGLPMIEE